MTTRTAKKWKIKDDRLVLKEGNVPIGRIERPPQTLMDRLRQENDNPLFNAYLDILEDINNFFDKIEGVKR